MAQCLARSQTFSQFIRPSSLLSYTSKSNSWKAMIGKGLNAMPALLKFLVLLVLFLSVHHANAFISLTSVAQNQVQVNHLTCLQQTIGDPRNEPSR
jgi:hypothetical protein